MKKKDLSYSTYRKEINCRTEEVVNIKIANRVLSHIYSDIIMIIFLLKNKQTESALEKLKELEQELRMRQ